MYIYVYTTEVVSFDTGKRETRYHTTIASDEVSAVNNLKRRGIYSADFKLVSCSEADELELAKAHATRYTSFGISL